MTDKSNVGNGLHKQVLGHPVIEATRIAAPGRTSPAEKAMRIAIPGRTSPGEKCCCNLPEKFQALEKLKAC